MAVPVPKARGCHATHRPPVLSEPGRPSTPWTHAQFKKQANLIMMSNASSPAHETDLLIEIHPPANFTEEQREALDQVANHRVVSVGRDVLNRALELKAELAGAVPYALGIEIELTVIERDEDGNETVEMESISAENAKCLGLALVSFGMPKLNEILENGALGTHE